MKKRPKDVRVAELKKKLSVKEAYIERLLSKITVLKQRIQKLEETPQPTPPVVEPPPVPATPEPVQPESAAPSEAPTIEETMT